MNRTIAVVLARMGSSRLPAKNLAVVAGKPMVVHIIERLKRMEAFDEVVLATPDGPKDVPLQEAGRKAGAVVFAGAETDVLK